MNSPKIVSRPGPRITPNTKYDQSGHPIDHPYTVPVKAPSSLLGTFSEADYHIKVLPNGNIAIGDV